MRGRHSEATRAKISASRAPYTQAQRAERLQRDKAVAMLFAPVLKRLCVPAMAGRK